MSRLAVSTSFPPDFLSRLDSYCAESHLSRSAVIRIAVNEFLDAKEKTPIMKQAFADLFLVLHRASTGDLAGSELESELSRLQISFDELKA